MKVNINPKKLGQEISRLRQTKQLALQQIADETGLSLAYLEQLEAGDVEKIRKKEIKRLSRVLDIPAPCVKILGVEPSQIPDKLMGRLAESVQDAIRACVQHQADITETNNTNGEDKPKKKKKKK